MVVVALLSAAVVAGCGGGGDETAATSGKSARAAALSLQQAMNRASQGIDQVRRTQASVERLGATLQSPIAQTGDVVVLLTPQAGTSGPEATLLTAGRQQRSFLQFASDATDASSRRAANNALARAEAAGRRASATYERLAAQDNTLAGLLPAATTFNTGRLRDAVRAVHGRSGGSGSSGSKGGGSSGSGGGATPTTTPSTSDCGDGVSVNSVTSCPFGRAVKDAFESSGGASTVDAYSPVTGRVYTMSCSSGIPTVCRGGNNAVVVIR